MKKVVTVSMIVLVVLGFAFFLFKISPQQVSPGGYNAALTTSTENKQLTEPPAFDPTTDRYLGNPGAKNIFIEYGDMQCPACASYSDILKQVPAEFTDTVFVFRHFPLLNIHQNTVESALAVEAAGAQGKYWEMHDILFKKQFAWQSMAEPLDTFAQYAQEVGVANIDQFKSDISDKKYLSKIQNDYNQATWLNLQGTPALFFNGHSIKTGSDLQGLKKEAEQYLNK
jgi:protein-disulfide isomerase